MEMSQNVEGTTRKNKCIAEETIPNPKNDTPTSSAPERPLTLPVARMIPILNGFLYVCIWSLCSIMHFALAGAMNGAFPSMPLFE